MPDAWMPNVARAETAAYSSGLKLTPIGICSHIMQGKQATMVRWSKERPPVNKVSAHFTIGRNGKVYQHVPLDKWSWCQGRLDPGHPPTWPRYIPGVNPNSQLVSIEHEGVYTQEWTAKMLASSIRVQKWVCREFGIEPSDQTIIGHRVLAPVSRKFDPGPHWPQAQIIAELRDALGYADMKAILGLANAAHDGAHHAQHAALTDKDEVLATRLDELTKRVDRVEARMSGASDALRAG